MAIKDDRIYHGFLSLLGGVDSGRDPALIRDDQLAKAINVTFRGGQLGIRPAFDRVDLEFDGADLAASFADGTMQGGAYFLSGQGAQIVIAVEGRVFQLLPEGVNQFRVREVTPEDDPLSAAAAQITFCQAGRYLVIQDGVSNAVIFDGFGCRRAGEHEVPVGRIMAYGLGRLWVSNGLEIFAGDLAGTGVDAEIKFTEQEYLNEGGSFVFPADLGTLRALVFPPVQDTATGSGELLLLGDYGAQTIFASISRDQWKNVQIERVTLRNYGATGPAAWASVNGDVIYRSIDGIRSYRMARAEQAGWGHTAISREVRPILDRDSPDLLKYARAAFFDNRWFVTASPELPDRGGVRFRNLVVLDFDIVSSAQEKSPPAYDGIWTGLFPTELVTGRFGIGEEMYVFSLDEDGRNRVYRMTRDGKLDAGTQRITALIETKRYDFQSPFNEKLLWGGDLWVEELEGELDIDVKWRPDGMWCWANWCAVHECAQMTTSMADGCFLATPRPQHRPRLQFPTPPDTADPIGYGFLRRGMSFQLRMQITGTCKFSKFRVHARPVTEEVLNASS